MNHTFQKIWSGEKISFYAGIDFFDWALPVHVASYGRKQLLLAILCFYASVEWD